MPSNTFTLGDRVHIINIGTGVVREARNGGRYLIDIKGRTILVAASQLERAAPERRSRSAEHPLVEAEATLGTRASAQLDLHGKTVAEAIEALDVCLNQALLDGLHDVRVIHGRSGGRVKAAVHQRLNEFPSIRSFRIDPRNPGVTVVVL